MHRVIDPMKLIQARGRRTQGDIVRASHGQISRQNISQWERGLYAPRQEHIAALLDALGVSFEDITSPYEEMVQVAQESRRRAKAA